MARFLFGHIKKRPLQPIGSTESPPLVGKSDVDSALNVFLTAKNWRDAIDVLGTQEAVLLTDDARKVLLQRIKQLRKHSPKDDSVKKLRLYLHLLDEVRAHGIDAGWDSFFFYLVRRRHRIRWAVLQLILWVFPPMQRKMKELSKQVLQQNLLSNSPSHGDEGSDPRVTELVRASQNKSAILLEFVKFRRVLNELDELDETNEDYLDAVEARKIALLTDLTVRAKHPTIRAYAQVELGQALSRYAGSSDLEDKIGMLEQAIEHFEMAAQTFDRNSFPLNWATVQMNFADASLVLAQARDEGGGRQQAVIYLEQALEVFTRDQFPEQWAQIHHKLGVMYTKQTYGDPAENLEQAIDHYQLALEVFTRDEKHLRDWAFTQWFLGNAYRTRIWGDRRQNLEEAVACYDRALDFFTFETFAFYDEIHTQRSFALEQLGKLAEAHASLMAVRAWQHEAIERGNSIAWIGHSINERASGDIYERDAWILLCLSPSNLEKVVEVLEEGRAQAQRVALNLDSLEPARIKDPLARARAEAFIHARDAWRAAQKEIQTPLPQRVRLGDAQAIKMQQDRQKALEEAHTAFARARDAIRQYDIEDFLSPALSFSQIAQAVDHSDEALIYLVAGEQEGMAVIVMCDQQGHPCVSHLALPNLQEKAVINLHVEEEERFVREGDISFPLGLEPAGGLALAQAKAGFQYLFKWGTSVCDAMNNLPSHSGLRLAGQALLQQWREDPYLYDLLEETSEDLNEDDTMTLMGAFAAEHLSVELERSSQKLGELGLSNLAIWLQKQQIHKVTLIPYGRLGFFPLPAVVIQTEEGKKTWLGDLFEVTFAPSAQALKKAKERAANLDPTKRPQILAAGNPQPLTTEYASLPFAEAEAQNTKRIAEKFGAGLACCLTADTVTKKRMIDELEKAWLAHLALHGQFYFDAPRKSRLILAGNEELLEVDRTISLDECLRGALNLVGMRLLVLSACETSLIDFQAINEMIGIAAGFLQAGAAGVIASLWEVNDQATYLLMSRFMQLFLDPAQQDSTPAYCLAAAQRWLREEATNRILATYDPATLEGTQQTGEGQPATFSDLEYTLVNMGGLERPYSKLHPLEKIQFQARKRMQSEPEGLPYADPFYWAAFVMIGC